MCAKCHGSGYVPAPADNAWRLYFARIGRPNQNVLVDCPDCKCQTCGTKLRTNESVPYCPCCDGNP